jgi:hypothetical protein
VVDRHRRPGQVTTIVWLAVVIAPRGRRRRRPCHSWTRWYSARIGEGVILTSSVFTHVQKMPIAFFSPRANGAP